jgi:hypothetical protein
VTPGCLGGPHGLDEKSIRHSSLDSVGRYMSPATCEWSSAVSRKKMLGQYAVRLRCKPWLYILKKSSQTPRSTTTRLGERCEQSTSDKLVQTGSMSPTATPTRTLITNDPNYYQHHFEIHSSSVKVLRSYYLRRSNQIVGINSTYHRERFGYEIYMIILHYLRQSHLGSTLDLRIESRGQRHGDVMCPSL